MNWSLITISVLAFAVCAALFRFTIPFAYKYGLVDHPSSRRRHSAPMPIVGGVTVFSAWIVAVAIYSAVNPGWIAANAKGTAVTLFCVTALSLMGLYDDMKGLPPRVRLSFEFALALVVMLGVPEVNYFCITWYERLGPLIWPLVGIWLVGVSNAVNLVDGLDGLAASISSLVCVCLLMLAAYSTGESGFAPVVLGLLLPNLFAFLRKNWSPARVFLGDNGSLPIGFLLGVGALSGPIAPNSYNQVLGLILMLGYPILDMGLCCLRRMRQGTPIFKADRNHLHHRLLRLGLSVPQVVTTVLSINLFLLVNASTLIIITRYAYAELGRSLVVYQALLLALPVLSLFSLLYLLKRIEENRTEKISDLVSSGFARGSEARYGFQKCLVAKIHLQPLFESALLEERRRIDGLLKSLHFMIDSMLSGRDAQYFSKQVMHIVFVDRSAHWNNEEELAKVLRDRLSAFQRLYGVQYSASDLKISFETQDHLVARGPPENSFPAGLAIHERESEVSS